jgi:hypothetical protein
MDKNLTTRGARCKELGASKATSEELGASALER